MVVAMADTWHEPHPSQPAIVRCRACGMPWAAQLARRPCCPFCDSDGAAQATDGLVDLFARAFQGAAQLPEDVALDAARQVVAGLPAAVGSALETRGPQVIPRRLPSRVVEQASEMVGVMAVTTTMVTPAELELAAEISQAPRSTRPPPATERSPGERAHLPEVSP